VWHGTRCALKNHQCVVLSKADLKSEAKASGLPWKCCCTCNTSRTALFLLQIVVQCTPDKLLIKFGEKVILNGQLYSQIKREDSMWLLENSILHLNMLKRNRRGNYANQCTNADTFWKSVLKSAPHQERLTMAYPPDKYYALPFEGCDSSHLPLRLTSSHAASQGQLVGQRVQARNQQ